jgi:hypothetical protein
MERVIKKLKCELVDFLKDNKLQIICKSHFQENDIYSWTYFLASEDVWEFEQNEKQQFPTALELEMGVGKKLIEGKSVTVLESSDGDWTWIR